MDQYYKRFFRNTFLQIFILIIICCYLLVGCVKVPSSISDVNNMPYNIAETVSDCKDGYINYNVKRTDNAEPVITIWNSYCYGEIDDMKTILTYIINSPIGIECGLSEDNLEYYVKEWYVLNIAHLCPLNAKQIIGGDPDDIVNRTTHADLNTDDQYAKMYQEIFAILRKKI